MNWVGGPGGESKSGAGDDDLLNGMGGNDTLSGLGGDDTLIAGTGADSLNGGVDHDLLVADDLDGSFDELAGGDGDDTMKGSFGDDLQGGSHESGNWYFGDWGIINLKTAQSVDLVVSFSADGTGSVGGTMAGVAQAAATLSGIEHLVVMTGSGADHVVAGQFDTEIRGGFGNDTLLGLAGYDTLVAGFGADILAGGLGDDVIKGGDNDSAIDRLSGDQGDDVVLGFFGDVMKGGADDDDAVFDFVNLVTPVVINLSRVTANGSGPATGTIDGATQAKARLSGFERTLVDGGWGADVIQAGGVVAYLEGNGGDDTLYGGGARDTLVGGAGNDRLYGGRGFDFVSYHDVTPFLVGVSVDLGAQAGSARGAANPAVGQDFLKGIEGVLGTNFTDDLVGDKRTNLLVGYYGGEDTLDGAAGDDILDVDVSRGASKIVVGGVGRDTISFDYCGPASGVLKLDLRLSGPQATGGSANVTAFSVENVSGGANAENFIGNGGKNTLAGGDGQDFLDGEAGDDLLLGDGQMWIAGGDVAWFAIWSADQTGLQAYLDALYELSDEEMTSGRYDDRIYGGTGDDTIHGGVGADTLGGSDYWDGVELPLSEAGYVNVFLYQSELESQAGFSDYLFLRADDIIDLADIDANINTDADDAFVRVAALTGVAGQLTLIHDAPGLRTLITGDTDGDGVGEFQIAIEGDAADFNGIIL